MKCSGDSLCPHEKKSEYNTAEWLNVSFELSVGNKYSYQEYIQHNITIMIRIKYSKHVYFPISAVYSDSIFIKLSEN